MAAESTAKIFVDSLGKPVPREDSDSVTWRVAVYVLAIREGRVLMKLHPQVDRWELPGGAAEPSESLGEGARRECREETGYAFSPSGTTPVHVDEAFFYHRGTGQHHHSLLFVLRGKVGDEPGGDWTPNTREARSISWVDPVELSPSNTPAFHWAALAKAKLVPT